jgi:hypothetical protein
MTGLPLYLLEYGNAQNMFFDGKTIAVKLSKGPHSPTGNLQSFTSPVGVGMKINWESNTSTPATVKSVFVGYSNPDSMIHQVMYIDLDKPVDQSARVFYLTGPEGFQMMSPASILTQGFQADPIASPAMQQALEFKLGQNAVSSHIQRNWMQ